MASSPSATPAASGERSEEGPQLGWPGWMACPFLPLLSSQGPPPSAHARALLAQLEASFARPLLHRYVPFEELPDEAIPFAGALRWVPTLPCCSQAGRRRLIHARRHGRHWARGVSASNSRLLTSSLPSSPPPNLQSSTWRAGGWCCPGTWPPTPWPRPTSSSAAPSWRPPGSGGLGWEGRGRASGHLGISVVCGWLWCWRGGCNPAVSLPPQCKLRSRVPSLETYPTNAPTPPRSPAAPPPPPRPPQPAGVGGRDAGPAAGGRGGAAGPLQ